MISCKKAALICNKSQYNEATFIEKLQLRFHLVVCKTCSKFSKKNKQLTYLCDKAGLNSLSEGDKRKMKEKLQAGAE